jgi:hypothetical protein
MMGSLKQELRAVDSSVNVHTISPGMVLTGSLLLRDQSLQLPVIFLFKPPMV